jgi:hypothetical protein
MEYGSIDLIIYKVRFLVNNNLHLEYAVCLTWNFREVSFFAFLAGFHIDPQQAGGLLFK